MDLKQFLWDRVILFFALTTMISIAIFALGSLFDADARFGYDALLSPLIFAGACTLPTIVTYSKKELPTQKLLFRMILEFLLIEAVVLSIAFFSPTIEVGDPVIVLSLAFSVFLIYLVALLLDWIKASMEAKRLNEDLARFQRRHDLHRDSALFRNE